MSIIEASAKGPINELFFAINYYVSTGDNVGEGVAMEGESGEIIAMIGYNPKNKTDFLDYKKFRSRIHEIIADGKIAVRLEEFPGHGTPFLQSNLYLREADLRRLAAELARTPGAAGWGSMQPIIDKTFPGVREKIASGEGV